MWKFVFGVLVGFAAGYRWVWYSLEDEPEQEPLVVGLGPFEAFRRAQKIDAWPGEVYDQGAEGSSVGYAMVHPWAGRKWYEDFRCAGVAFGHDQCTREMGHDGDCYFSGIDKDA